MVGRRRPYSSHIRRKGVSLKENRAHLEVSLRNQTKLTATNEGPRLSESETTSPDDTKELSFPKTPSFRECLKFAIPTLGIYTCPPLMSLIDASFIGRLKSVEELAALGPAASISDSAPLPLLFLSIAATNLIASTTAEYEVSEEEAKAQCGRISRTSMSMGAAGGILLSLLLYSSAAPVSQFFINSGSATATSSSAALVSYCTSYVAIRALALPAAALTSIAQAICIGQKDSKTPMLAVVLAGCLNFIGDLVLVKRWGIAGVAWATALSQYAAMGLLLLTLQRRGLLFPPSIDKKVTDKLSTQTAKLESLSLQSTVVSLLGFVPFIYVMGVKIFMHNACASTAVGLGGPAAAAHTALFAVGMLCFTFGDAAASMAQAYLPAFRRNGQYYLQDALPTLKQLLKCTWSISGTVVILATTILTCFGHKITSSAAVLREMRRVLPLVAATLCVHGTAVTLEGLLLSRKMFRPLMIIYSGVAISIALWMAAVQRFGAGLTGVWGCYVWFSASRIIAFSTAGGLFQPVIQGIRRRWHAMMMRMRKTLS